RPSKVVRNHRKATRNNDHVRFWPKADMTVCAAHVRFRGQSGHALATSVGRPQEPFPSLPEEIEDQTEDDAENNRRHDGKVEDEVTAPTLVLDVSGQQGYGRRLVALI